MTTLTTEPAAKSSRDFLSLRDIGAEALAKLVDRSLYMADGNHSRPLTGKVVGIYFRRPSTRTRTAFSVGAIRLGAAIVTFGPADLQLVSGETIKDTARVLAEYLDALVIRTNEKIDEMRTMAEHSDMAIVNALSDDEHPTQVIGDLATLKEEFGDLADLHVLYVGEGNNTAAALALAVAQTPRMRLTIVSPEGYGIPPSMLEAARSIALSGGGAVEQRHDVGDLPDRVDAVYTSRWQTMGDSKPEPDWHSRFRPFKVTQALMRRVSGPGTVFLHDLPAVRGGDVDDDVLDGPQSRAFRQARHKMTSAMAILEWCLEADVP